MKPSDRPAWLRVAEGRSVRSWALLGLLAGLCGLGYAAAVTLGRLVEAALNGE